MISPASTSWRRSHRRRSLASLAALLAVAVAACQLPGLDLETTRSLESGATASLRTAKSLQITGTYAEPDRRWSIDLQLARPDLEHVTLRSEEVSLESIVIGRAAYFRGRQFLAGHLGPDFRYQELAKVAGEDWWRGSLTEAMPWPDHLTEPAAFSSTFLGPALNERQDHVLIDGVEAVKLSGPRAVVYVAQSRPHQLLHLTMRRGVVVDGLAGADLRYGSFNVDFGIAPPARLLDFSNLAVLPPSYAVVSVDTAGCRATCRVAAQIRNLGGKQPAKAPSTVTFKATEPVSGRALGSCRAPVAPDVGPGETATVACVIEGFAASAATVATVAATAENPGRA